MALGSLHMEFKGYHAELFDQLRADNAINSRVEYDRGYGYPRNGVGRCFPRICRHWTPAYTRYHFCLVNLVPAFAFTPYDAM